jgi:hypothetical protein
MSGLAFIIGCWILGYYIREGLRRNKLKEEK